MIQISLKNLKSNDKKEKLWNYVVYMILDAQLNGLKEIYLLIKNILMNFVNVYLLQDFLFTKQMML